MSYITELRSLVGRRPLVLAGVSVLLVTSSKPGCILLQRRSDNGRWSPPGGMIEPGESAEETAVREVAEESGYTIGYLELTAVISGKNAHCIYPNGDEVYNVTIVFIAEIDDSIEVRSHDDETLGLQWFHLDMLPEDLSPPSQYALTIISTNHQACTQIRRTPS